MSAPIMYTLWERRTRDLPGWEQWYLTAKPPKAYLQGTSTEMPRSRVQTRGLLRSSGNLDYGNIHEQVAVKAVAEWFCELLQASIRRCRTDTT